MGLNLSHGCWDGAYSAFNRWRTMIAQVAGMPPLCVMDGFWYAGGQPFDLVKHIEPGWVREGLETDIFQHLPIKWESLKPDPLHELLYHSDCDGVLPSASCAAIADRLSELLPKLPGGEAPGHIGNWRDKTSTFIEGLRLAASLGEDVDFH